MNKTAKLIFTMFVSVLSVGCVTDDDDFPVKKYTLTVLANMSEWGDAQGGGMYEMGECAHLEATAAAGYFFIRWSDSIEQNPRTVTVNCDMTLYALFSDRADDPNPYNPLTDSLPNPGEDTTDIGPNPPDQDTTIPEPPVPVNGGFDSNGASYALFSVSTVNRVRFSRGNLWYKASTDTWSFPAHQYDYVGTGNANISSTYNDWIDMFAWGTSGWFSGANAYQPWSVSIYAVDYYPGGGANNDLTAGYAEADWAWHNAIINGGNQTHMWRTLTTEEWQYLIGGRANASQKLGYATVADQTGMVILPDIWVTPNSVTFIPGSGNGWNTNVYTIDDWSYMEKAGAIFLPAAGYRQGLVTSGIGALGRYWSVSHQNNQAAYNLHFLAPNFNVLIDGCDRQHGLCVRPVMDE